MSKQETTRSPSSSARTTPMLLAALVFLVAMNLRPTVTSVGPLLPRIGADLQLSETAQGLIGALPLLAFAAASPLVYRITRRTGANVAILLALLVLAAGITLRSYGAMPGLWIGTVIAGLAIGVGNVLVPVIVRRDFSARISLATSILTLFMTTAAATASGIAVPLADRWDWRSALAFWAIPAVVVAAVWSLRLTRGSGPAVPEPPAAPSVSVWRQPRAWLVTAFMGLQSTAFYILATWLPTLESVGGIPETSAGVHLSVYQLVGALSGLTVPLLMRRSVLTATITVSVPMVIATAGLLLAPQAAVVWAVVAGLSSGTSLVVALSLISIRARSIAETVQLSGMAQSIGYLLAAVGPVAFGWLAGVTDSWQVPLVLLGTVALIQLTIAVLAGREPREHR